MAGTVGQGPAPTLHPSSRAPTRGSASFLSGEAGLQRQLKAALREPRTAPRTG